MDNSTIPLKKCSKCGQEKPATTQYFHAATDKKSGFRSHCKVCKNEHYQTNKDRISEKQRQRWQQNRENLNAARREEYRNNPAEREKIMTRNRKYIQENPEKKRQFDRRYYAQNQDRIRAYNAVNRERKTEYMQVYRKDKREELTASKRRYYRINKELINKQRRDYYSRNREYIANRQKLYSLANPIRARQIKTAAHQKRRARKHLLPDTFTTQHWRNCLEYFHNTCAVCGGQLRDLFGDVEPHADHWIALNQPDCPGTTPDNMLCLCNGCNLSKKDKQPAEWLIMRFGSHKTKAILERIKTYFEWVKQQ